MSDESKRENKKEAARSEGAGDGSSVAEVDPKTIKGDASLSEVDDADDAADEDAPAPASASPHGEEDAFRPEAIAERIEKMQPLTEEERIARAEEQKLAERKKSQKKGLQASAAKRLDKIGNKPSKRPVVAASAPADTVEYDPMADKAARFGDWIQKNSRVVWYAMGALLLVAGGIWGATAYRQKQAAAASAIFGEAQFTQRGIVRDKEPEDKRERVVEEYYTVYKTEKERRAAGLEKYKQVIAKYPGSGPAVFARLAEASLLLDEGDHAAAETAYRDAAASALAKVDTEVRGRAHEGIGLALELRAIKQKDAANWDAAIAAYKELEKVDNKGFRLLALYHQARCLEAKGDKSAALEGFNKLQEEIVKTSDGKHPFPYLEKVVRERISALDPSKAAAAPSMPFDLNNLMGQ